MYEFVLKIDQKKGDHLRIRQTRRTQKLEASSVHDHTSLGMTKVLVEPP